MNGMQYHGKWILVNRLMNTKHQKTQETTTTQKHRKRQIQMTKTQRRKRQKITSKIQMTQRRCLRTFQTLQQTWGITHTYVAPHPLKVHLFPQDHRLQLSDITQGK